MPDWDDTVPQDYDETKTNTDITELIPSTQVEPLQQHPEAQRIPLVDLTSTKYKQQSTARIMRKAVTKELPAVMDYRIHLDGGANLSVTHRSELLINYKNIRRHAIAGVAQDGPAIYATGIGYLPWRAEDGTTILIKCYYSENAADTIISPTDIVINKFTDYNAWSQYVNVDTGQGYIAFHHRRDTGDTIFPLTSSNGLWYYHTNGLSDYRPTHQLLHQDEPCLPQMSKQEEYELFHFRLGCAGEGTMDELHKHVEDCPAFKRNTFRRCKICMQEKCTYRPMPSNPVPCQQAALPATATQCHEADDQNALEPIPHSDDSLLPGQMFQMDFGFVQGTGYSEKDEDGRRVTSLDGMNCYLIIVDRKTRRTWVFTRKNKEPPIDLVRRFLQQNKCKAVSRLLIRTDQGGELYKSDEFKTMCVKEGFLMEPTAADASFQNGLAERPNRSLAVIMRCLLRNSGLGPEYWSWALVHAAYIKNRLPHRSTGQTPYFGWSGKKPSIKYLRIFGCPVIVRLPGPQPAKLDHHTAHGVFLGYTATDHNIYYQDFKTKRVKIATHVKFDEAGYTLPKASLPPAMQILQDLGHKEPPATEIPGHQPEETIQVKLLSDKAKLPVRAMDAAAGYDLYSAHNLTIAPNTRARVKTDISITPPPGTYGQIMS